MQSFWRTARTQYPHYPGLSRIPSSLYFLSKHNGIVSVYQLAVLLAQVLTHGRENCFGKTWSSIYLSRSAFRTKEFMLVYLVCLVPQRVFRCNPHLRAELLRRCESILLSFIGARLGKENRLEIHMTRIWPPISYHINSTQTRYTPLGLSKKKAGCLSQELTIFQPTYLPTYLPTHPPTTQQPQYSCFAILATS
jgi:hypothetical protein